ncbi:response regulator [Pontibacter sp. SGAir0037]|uniref:hybrid sensor histidine kinase/response regulator n=1 Tax=Pontibacter sp. SGAir0037 TaxID=2571030 RepID=UPI0010CD0033|nr:response regulator [Pontibacter sp. SGAir0037]QCR22991.1 hypothetical protein C1N53_11985 [Pontibacter sp. SGAir0037]
MVEELNELLRILIIDDDEVDRMSIRRSLRKTSISAEIFTAETASCSLELLRKESFDCIFLDFKLPDMDGLELLEQIREMGILAPVLVVTSHGDEQLAAKAIRQGASDYIPKSLLTPEGIYHSIKTAIRLHKVEQDKRQAEEKLRTTQQQFEFVVSNTPINFWRINQDKIISFASGLGLELIGLPAEKVMGLSIYDACARYPHLIEKFERAFKGERVESVTETNGYFFKSQYLPISNEKQEIVSVIGFAFDVTESILHEQELTKAKELAEESVRTKEQFIANISHEIRTPMNGIIGLASVLQKTALAEDQRKYLKAIQTSADTLMHIINDLLDFSKISAQKFTFEYIDFNLPQLFDEVTALMDVRVKEKNNIFNVSLAPTVPPDLVGDPVRLKQIIINLVGNASKFTQSGSISLSASAESETENEVVLKFKVEDTGIGIPQEKLQAIFESFNQGSNDTSRKYGGTGLGLTISKSLVELQGGNIAVWSQPNVGSAFTFTLPFKKKEDQQLVAAPEAEYDEKNLGHLKVLLAEDNEINQLLLNKVLSDWGIRCEIVSNGVQAMECFHQLQYDLILMDMQMPEMDGYEAIRRIRNSGGEGAHTPIIALTAHASAVEIDKCIEAGANTHLSKPFNPAHLYQAILKLTQSEQQPLADSGSTITLQLGILRDMAGSNSSFLEEILTMYVKGTSEAIAQINSHYEQQEWNDLQQCLTELSDSMSVINVQPLLDTIEEASAMVTHKKTEQLDVLIKKMALQGQQVITLLEQELESLAFQS